MNKTRYENEGNAAISSSGGSSSERAAMAIREMIQEGGWRQGRKLPSQRELSLRLGVSRPMVREALVMMKGLGEVEIVSGKGVYVARRSGAPISEPPVQDGRPPVTGLTAGRAAQMYQFRYAIEPAVARLVAVNATLAQIEDLRGLLAQMREALAKGDLTRLAELDFAFHRQLVEAANNPFFTMAIAPSLNMFFESQQLPFATSADTSLTITEHEALLEGVRRRSPAEASDAMKLHILGAAARAGIAFGVDPGEEQT